MPRVVCFQPFRKRESEKFETLLYFEAADKLETLAIRQHNFVFTLTRDYAVFCK